MGISTSDKPYLERIEDAKSDHFMQAAVAKAQDAQFIKRTKARREMGNWPLKPVLQDLHRKKCPFLP